MNTVEAAPTLSVLRQRATALLAGARADDPRRFNASEAMGVLFQLASSPITAPDALAMLHELQVHQVELDLQHEELRASRDELEWASVRHAFLFDHAPVGYLDIDAATVAREINRAAVPLLGRSRAQLLGRPLVALLDGPSQATLQSMIARAQLGGSPRTHELKLRPEAGTQRVLHATTDRNMRGDGFLLALMALPGADEASPDGVPAH